MALSFAISEERKTKLWDFGWFILTRFKVAGPVAERHHCNQIFEDFLRAPISQRSFCSPGHWGDPVERHGPFLNRDRLGEWFKSISAEELKDRVQAVLGDAGFIEQPSAEQRSVVEAWAAAVQARGDSVFALDVPDLPGIRVDWAWVWTVYQEFASLSPDREELSIGVIGYD